MVFHLIFSAIVPATQIVVAVLASFFVNLEVHVTLDKYTFKLRKRSDFTLINAITEKCKEVNCEFVQTILANQNATLRQYYHLINKMKPDQSYLFDRWARYYINLYVLLFSVLIIVASLLLWLTLVPLDGLFVVGDIFLIIFIITLRSISKQKTQVQEVAVMTPSRFLSWDDGEVLKHLLIICKTSEKDCPWVKNVLMRESVLKV